MILNLIIAALAVALILYTLFGGADYGAGILSLCPWGKNKNEINSLISKTISPVWEANHVWLILIVVILFVGFPPVYTAITRHLHWPVVAVLIGIIARGCAFTFMHYDAIKDASQRWYQWIFALASLWTSFWLGVVLGGISSGEIVGQGTVFEVFFAGWVNMYSFLLGLFVVAIFSALASIYLLGETADRFLRLAIIRKAVIFSLGMVVLGALVFWSSHFVKGQMVHHFLDSTGSLLAFIAATGLLFLLNFSLKRQQVLLARVFAGGSVACVVIGWMNASFPVAVAFVVEPIVFYEVAADQATLSQLLMALVIGLCLILPSLGFLYNISRSQ